MLPVMFARVGCKHYERKPIYLVVWLKYKNCETGVNMPLKQLSLFITPMTLHT